MTRFHRTHAILALVAAALVQHAGAADLYRGKQLFETHCLVCHTTGIYKREKPKVKDWEALRREVRQWQREAGQRWNAEEIDDVAAYLNEFFYRFPKPTPASDVR